MKIEKEYEERFGDIPISPEERMIALYKSCRFPEKIQAQVEKEIERIKSIPWGEYKYTIYLLPKATPRPRTTSKGKFFYVKGAADNKKYFYKKIMKEDWDIITTPTIFDCVSYFPPPSNLSKVNTILAEMGYMWDISMPDFDNLAKTYSDMIKGILLFDDRLIVDGRSVKRYSIKPRIEVSVKYMKDYDTDYNKKKVLKSIEELKKKAKV